MKIHFLNALAIIAIPFCLTTTGCKKDATPAIDPTKVATTKKHDTIVLRADANTDARILSASNIEMGIGNLNGSDYSGYPTIELNAIAWTIGGAPVVMRGLFNFIGIPSGTGGTPPEAAYLTLYSDPAPLNGDLVHANAGSNNAFYVRRVTNSWVATSTNWFNQPATTTDGQVFIPHTTSPFLDLVNIDVTQIVRDMYTYGNYGFMIQLQTESYYNSRIFCSSSVADVSKHPTLTLIF